MRSLVTLRRDQRLLAWLAQQLGWESAEASIERIGEGHSREMLIIGPARSPAVVVRLEQGGVFGTASAEECRVMSGLRARGIPVARILAFDAGDALGRPFFVMEFVPGEAGNVPTSEFVAALHAVHRLEIDEELRNSFDLRPQTATEAILGQIERWYEVYRASVESPIGVLDTAREWLRRRCPDDGRLSVVHGDAGPGNFVHDGHRVLALTDWEFAHLGDSREDWSFCAAIRGTRLMSRVEWTNLIEERTGVTFDDRSWTYWEAFNLFKGACANLTCRHLYETGRHPAPNMAIIGTALYRIFARRLDALIT